MSGTIIEFSTAAGGNCQGYLSIPAAGKGPAVIVIQEWWGLVDHIKQVADRFAETGFVALAPDLYHGVQARQPDEAGRLMMALNIDGAASDLSGAADFLLEHPAVTSRKVGTVGFCLGGQLSLMAACVDTRIGACVDYYGVHPQIQPDFSQLASPVLGFFGGLDGFVTPDAVSALEQQIRQAGKSVEFHVYPDADHAFFNDSRPEVYHRAHAEESWKRMLAFFHANL
ncbi:MAG TPA: dienelactone hydrolase family protein [Pseudomonadales bacterium]|jgi:carboxymethylenebutenolidase|nr:dienelactone hydrolase family protein [Pseudomonadales bacterium]HMW14644.1 dienelactone hydrolase family protein [Pseudomonadales bacterium]HMY97225.1 dienelactone hydrolase family protein [Pseudomonadales bacterium]HMZ71219.1 dienelactone hydrolase family protein [Pseudomonadales bacterium]